MHSARFDEISSRCPPARIPPPEHTCIHLKNDPAAFVFHPVFAPRTAPPVFGPFQLQNGPNCPCCKASSVQRLQFYKSKLTSVLYFNDRYCISERALICFTFSAIDFISKPVYSKLAGSGKRPRNNELQAPHTAGL